MEFVPSNVVLIFADLESFSACAVRKMTISKYAWHMINSVAKNALRSVCALPELPPFHMTQSHKEVARERETEREKGKEKHQVVNDRLKGRRINSELQVRLALQG